MSVKVRPYRRGGWEVDIRIQFPNGTEHRERKRSPASSRSAACRWGEARERTLIVNGLPQPRKEIPTLKEFWPRFMDGYVRANRQKPSGIASKEIIARIHLMPAFGETRLDAITTERVQQLKSRLHGRAPKTVDNVLTVLSVLLKKGVEWEVIDRMPCNIRLLPIPRKSAAFYDFGDYERLVAAARLDPNAYLIVLMGGEAGLRRGEMMALEWKDIDLGKRQLCVSRSDWRGHVTVPKGGRLRYVPMTKRLSEALRDERHVRGPRVLCDAGGQPLTQKMFLSTISRAARRANLKPGLHILRHTFCSHLAMRGAPARAIQELAGHQNIMTTERYMHLNPTAIENAIRLLDHARPVREFGDIVETA